MSLKEVCASYIFTRLHAIVFITEFIYQLIRFISSFVSLNNIYFYMSTKI